MSVLTQAVEAIKEAMKLADDVRRAGDTLKELAQEIRDHDRRITCLEAQWETATLLSRRRLERK
jgi:vacuolar-type H+-ATPase subunit D/Vma8